MIVISNGMTPAEHISALNSNFVELYGAGNFTAITSEMVGQSLIDVLTQNYKRSIVAIGNKGSYVIASTNNAFGPQIYYVKNGGNDSLSGVSDLEAWSYHPWMADYTGKTILKPGDTICLKSGDSWIKSNPTSPLLIVKQNGSLSKFITNTNYGIGNKPILKIDTSTAQSVVFASGKSFIKFDGIHIQHFSSALNSGMHGIFLNQVSHDFVIDNCEIDNIPHTCVFGYLDCYNISIGDVSKTTRSTKLVHSNNIHDFGYGAVILMGCNPDTLDSNFKVIGNYIHDSSATADGQNAYGISFTAGTLSSDWPKNCIADHNYVENIPTWEGIETHGGTYMYVRDNYVYNCARGIFMFNTVEQEGRLPILNHIYISGNKVSNPEFIGENLGYHSFIAAIAQYTGRSNNIEITNNEIGYDTIPTNGYLYGIYYVNSDGILVTGNKIVNGDMNGKVAIKDAGNCLNGVIENNTVENWPL